MSDKDDELGDTDAVGQGLTLRAGMVVTWSDGRPSVSAHWRWSWRQKVSIPSRTDKTSLLSSVWGGLESKMSRCDMSYGVAVWTIVGDGIGDV
jgi:hypothetical protein